MNDDLFEKAKHLADRPYPFRIYRDDESDPDVMYVAESVDLDGCLALKQMQRARGDTVYKIMWNQRGHDGSCPYEHG